MSRENPRRRTSHSRSRRIQGAEHFQKTIRPLEDTEYEWVYSYSKRLYEKYRIIYKELDDKANEIIKYLGGGAGLFTLAVLLNVTAQNVAIVKWSMVAFLCSIFSVFFAAKARKPHATSWPPSPKEAFDYANRYGSSNNAQAAFVGEWHRACEGMKQRLGDKARWVTLATWLFFAAIVSLLLPLVVAISSPKPIP